MRCLALFLILLGWHAGCWHNDRRQGFHVVPLRNNIAGDVSQRYVAFVPPPQGSPPPVLLFLHGHGEKGSDGLFQISNNFGESLWRRRNQFPYLAVCPQCPIGSDWDATGPLSSYVLRCVDDAIARFGGDPNRVFVTGVSSGADGALRLVSAHPDRFAGLLLSSSGMGGQHAVELPRNLPLRSLANLYDKPELRADFDAANQKWHAAGLQPSTRIVKGSPRFPHNAWDETFNSPISLAWFMHPAIPGDDVIHFEAFVGPEKPFVMRLQNSNPADGQYAVELHLEKPRSGSGGLRDSAGSWLATLDPVAQQSLVDGWNEIRIVRTGRQLQVEVGLWPAISAEVPSLAADVCLSFLAVDRAAEVRYLRMSSDAIVLCEEGEQP